MRTFSVVVGKLIYPPLEAKKAIDLMEKMQNRGHIVFCFTDGDTHISLDQMRSTFDGVL